MFSSTSLLVIAIAALQLFAARGATYDCPKSASLQHAGCMVSTLFKNPCSAVQQEVLAR